MAARGASRKKQQGMTVAVVDTETTGLTLHPDAPRALQPRITEFAGVVLSVDLSSEEEPLRLREDVWLCDPGVPLTAEITKITGLTTEDVRGQPPFSARVERLTEFMAGVDVMVAHNLPFDGYMLTHELQLCGALTAWRWPPVMIDTAAMYAAVLGYRPRLINLYELVCGRPYAQTHRALDDVNALAEIFCAEPPRAYLAAASRADGIYLPPELRPDNEGRCAAEGAWVLGSGDR